MHAQSTAAGFDDEISLNIVALIDICFLLLSFLLLGAQFRNPQGEIESDLPKQGIPPRPPGPAPKLGEIRVTLRVTQPGRVDPSVPPSVQVEWTAGPAAPTRGGMAYPESELKKMATQDRKFRDDTPVVIESEPEVAYQWVIKALDLCRAARFKNVGFAASKRAHPIPPTKTGGP